MEGQARNLYGRARGRGHCGPPPPPPPPLAAAISVCAETGAAACASLSEFALHSGGSSSSSSSSLSSSLSSAFAALLVGTFSGSTLGEPTRPAEQLGWLECERRRPAGRNILAALCNRARVGRTPVGGATSAAWPTRSRLFRTRGRPSAKRRRRRRHFLLRQPPASQPAQAGDFSSWPAREQAAGRTCAAWAASKRVVCSREEPPVAGEPGGAPSGAQQGHSAPRALQPKPASQPASQPGPLAPAPAAPIT